ncbi:hypothetical protein Bhyg_10414 [Pseudolycoriella hygida]|uniref:Uncharacterized protein n=1 Tax=Pseudolycoriella hygida TaxID=35572 RepID=A0A9Q0RZA3_9DIPT|nr:hypothetical protein Bhyg_10414 [Pseudolycoriella hygida]
MTPYEILKDEDQESKFDWTVPMTLELSNYFYYRLKLHRVEKTNETVDYSPHLVACRIVRMQLSNTSHFDKERFWFHLSLDRVSSNRTLRNRSASPVTI